MPANILILYEGSRGEPRFIKRHFEVLGKAGSYVPLCYGCNLYNLYDHLSQNAPDGDFSTVDLPTLLRSGPPLPSQADRTVLSQTFTDIFLVFDLDIHDNTHTLEEKVKILRQLSEVYSDSSDNGLLLIDSPMVESYRDYSKDEKGNFRLNEPISISDSKRYKEIVGKRGVQGNVTSYKRELFTRLTMLNIRAIERIAGTDVDPSLSCQGRLIDESLALVMNEQGTLPIYNEMCLLPYTIFGFGILDDYD